MIHSHASAQVFLRNLAALQSLNTLKAEADRGTPLASIDAGLPSPQDHMSGVLMATGVDMRLDGELLGGKAQTNTCSPFPSAPLLGPGRAYYTVKGTATVFLRE